MAGENNIDQIRKEKLKALEMTLGNIEKQYGKGTIMKLGDTPAENIPFIPTGSIGLDAALGVGGFLVGSPAVAAAEVRSGDDSVADTARSVDGASPTTPSPAATADPRSRARSSRDAGAGSRAGSGTGSGDGRAARSAY